MQGAAEQGSRDGWPRAGKGLAQDVVMCEELLEGVWRAGEEADLARLWEGLLFFVLMTRNRQKILTCSGFFCSSDLSFPMGKKEGKRREKGGMVRGKENRRDETVTEKWE